MGRRSREERLAAKGRPKRRAAAKTHFFKYQLATDPGRAEADDLKRALEESLRTQYTGTGANTKKATKGTINNSTNSSDVSRFNNSSSGNESLGSNSSAASKRTRSSTSLSSVASFASNPNKRLKLTNGHLNGQQKQCDGHSSASAVKTTPTKTTNASTSPVPPINRAIKTYSRNQPQTPSNRHQMQSPNGPNSSTPITKATQGASSVSEKDPRRQPSVSKSTQTPNASGKTIPTTNSPQSGQLKKPSCRTSPHSAPTVNDSSTLAPDANNGDQQSEAKQTPVQDMYLKFKRESKNYAYAKMTALKVSTSKSPSGNSRSSSSKKPSPNGVLHNNNANKDSGKVSPKGANTCTSSSKSQTDTVKQSCNPTSNSIKNGHKADNKLTKLDSSSGKSSPTSISMKTVTQNGRPTDNNTAPKTSKNSPSLPPGKNGAIPTEDSCNLADKQDPELDCSLTDTPDLSSKKNQNQANVKVAKKRSPQGSWSLLGVPEEKLVLLRDDESPRRLICYPAIRHVEGDVIQVRDSVLLRSGARKTDLPYIAKICAFWEDGETGSVMMSLFWYYRPEHTEEGRKSHHLPDEIFASRHRDVDSVECIEDKCYVLTFNEYCRYRKRCKMEKVNTTWSLTDVTIPVSNESYPRRDRIPDSDVNPELVFCCRQIYDSRMRRLVKNPLINPKYGHI